jgi:hypothetical protein
LVGAKCNDHEVALSKLAVKTDPRLNAHCQFQLSPVLSLAR